MTKAETPGDTAGSAISKLEFQLALEIAGGEGKPWTDVVRQAAQATGSDVLFILPLPAADGAMNDHAVVRLNDGSEGRIVHVSEEDGVLAVQDEPEIDADLLGFARASIDVLERIKADAKVTAAGS